MDRKLYTLKQVAELFMVDPRTVMRWEREGKMTFIRLPISNEIRITQEEVDRLFTQTARG